MKRRATLLVPLVAFVLLIVGAATQQIIVRLRLQQDADGGGNSFTNLNIVSATGAVYAASITGPATNQFGGASGTGIVTNGGTGTNNIFTWSGQPARLAYDQFWGGKSNTLFSPYGPAETLAGGYSNWIGITADGATISGGRSNFISNVGIDSVVAGGFNNQIAVGGGRDAISGGEFNRINDSAGWSSILGGYANLIDVSGTLYSIVLGGTSNRVNNPFSLAAGTEAQALTAGTFVWADNAGGAFSSTSNKQFLIRAGGGVGINTNNPHNNALQVRGNIDASSYTQNGAPLAGGSGITGLTNEPLYLRGTNVIIGGEANVITNAPSDRFATILGGDGNFIGLAVYSSVGGYQNSISDSADYSMIGGGLNNHIRQLASESLIGGGTANIISNAAINSVISGGDNNTIGAGASYAVIPGGIQNSIGPSGIYSMAAGHLANVVHSETFVWSSGDSSPSATDKSFVILADNGVAIRTNDPAGNALRVRGNIDATSYSVDGVPLKVGVASYLKSANPISTATNVEVTAYLLFETNDTIHWPIQSAFSVVFSNMPDTLSWSANTVGLYETRTLIVTAEAATNIIQLDFRPRTNWICQGQTPWFPPLNLAPNQVYTFTLKHIGGNTNVFISYETATNSLAPF